MLVPGAVSWGLVKDHRSGTQWARLVFPPLVLRAPLPPLEAREIACHCALDEFCHFDVIVTALARDCGARQVSDQGDSDSAPLLATHDLQSRWSLGRLRCP